MLTLVFIFVTCLVLEAYTAPIFEFQPVVLRPFGEPKTIIRYIDLPENIMESTILNCEMPSVNKYEWKVTARTGGPYAIKVDLGDSPNQNIYKPAEYKVRKPK